MTVDDSGEDVGQIAEWVDVVEPTGFNQGGDGGPMLGTAVRHCEQRVRSVERDRALDGVEHGDMFERFAGDRRRTGCGELVKVTPDMRPAERQPDVAALRQLAVAGI